MTKQLLLLCAAAVCTFSTQATTSSHSSENPVNARQHLAKIAKEQRESASKWLPGTITTYNWGEDDWFLTAETKMTYDEKGQKLSETTGPESVTYTYDEKGNIVLEERFYNGTPSYRVEFVYDEVTNKMIGETSYYNDGNGWQLSNMYELRITRDDLGNITRVDDYSYDYDYGQMKLNNYSTIEYTNGKAYRIVNYDIDEGQEVVEFDLIDIVWKNTDGQIIVDDTNDMDLEDYFMGANRVESAIIRNYDNDGFDAVVNAFYPTDNGNVHVSMRSLIDMEEFYQTSYNVIDSNGSYSKSTTEVDYEVTDGRLVLGDTYFDTDTYIYDAYGIQIDYSSASFSTDYQSQSSSHAEVTYDPTYGYPLEVTVLSAWGDEQLHNTDRYVYSDYAEYSAVEGIVSDENAPVEYFNLQGIRVENPAAGIYIRRQGSETKKVLIK